VGGTSTRMMPTSQESPTTTEAKIVLRVERCNLNQSQNKKEKKKKKKQNIFFTS
jgi:hypothetical protein